MCGILALHNMTGTPEELREIALKRTKMLRHRGPDDTGIAVKQSEADQKYTVLCHERLSIVDPFAPKQPFYSEDQKIVCAVNGELFNHNELRAKYLSEEKHDIKSHNDCIIVPHLYEEGLTIDKIANDINGEFAFVLYDSEKDELWAVRDHIGVVPLYIGHGKKDEVYIASELKAIYDLSNFVYQLEPGHYFSSKDRKMHKYYTPQWHNIEHIPTLQTDLQNIRNSLIKSVERRLMTDVPFGILISGGLDSSIIGAIASRLYKKIKENDKNGLLSHKLHSFCIGLPGSPDLKAAAEVAKYLGTSHYGFTFTVEEGIDCIEDVIFHTETFNPTTIRASTPMYLLSRKIRSLGIKMVLTGEGSDELFGGYLYFHKAPNGKEFHQECVRKMQNLYKYDLLRANKSTMAFGLEGRVPFLDKDFIELIMATDPNLKMIKKDFKNIEKYILRKAFDTPDDPYLPEKILWRQKEQFSDGVGYNWVDGIVEYAKNKVTDEMFENAQMTYPIMTPPTKEAYYYRAIFEKFFPSQAAVLTVPQVKSVACSTEKALEWDENFKKNPDESGRRIVGVHEAKNSILKEFKYMHVK